MSLLGYVTLLVLLPHACFSFSFSTSPLPHQPPSLLSSTSTSRSGVASFASSPFSCSSPCASSSFDSQASRHRPSQGAWKAVFCSLLLLCYSHVDAALALEPQFYAEQIEQAMPLKTMRGVWRFQQDVGGRGCRGNLEFTGQYDQPNRGEVTLTSSDCYSSTRPDKPVRGPWRMKPSRFEGGLIQFNARWKLRAAEGSFIFRGDVTAREEETLKGIPNAFMEGEILKDSGNDNYKRVGRFHADLVGGEK